MEGKKQIRAGFHTGKDLEVPEETFHRTHQNFNLPNGSGLCCEMVVVNKVFISAQKPL